MDKGAPCALPKRAVKCAVKSCCCVRASQCEYSCSVRMSRQEKASILLSKTLNIDLHVDMLSLKVNARYLEQTVVQKLAKIWLGVILDGSNLSVRGAGVRV